MSHGAPDVPTNLTDPLVEAAERDLAEDASLGGAAALPTDLDLEAPREDALEQHTELTGGESPTPTSVPFETEPADLAEQARTAGADEDDYR